MYLELKQVHLTAVALSFVLFVLRGAWMLIDSPRLPARWVKFVPHLVDTVLLASALGLAYLIDQYPILQGWLTAKVLALCAYILLGALALRPGRPKGQRVAAFLAALLVFAYIVSVARAHDPAGFLAPLVR